MDTVSHRIRSLIVVALAAVAMLAMSVLPAAAQSSYPPGPPPFLNCEPSETPGGVVPPGLVRVCTLRGTLPSQVFDISYEYNPVVEFGQVTTGDDLEVVFELLLEREAVGQVVTVTAVAEDGDQLVLEDSFRVAGRADPPVDRGEPVTPGRPLARTGVDALLLGGIGVLLLGAGVMVVRRRDSRRASAVSGTHAE